MPFPEFRPAPGALPEEPGVYRFRDGSGRVIYVGKAKSLRQRVSSYFNDFANLHSRTQSMLLAAESVDWVVVGSEVEALQLEYSWIKEYDPRFNVKYRDDKSYPYLAITMGEAFPRALVTRGAKRQGSRYFGPYAHAWAIRDTLDILLRVFPIRTCTSGVFARAQRSGRPCLLADIGKCSAPCVGRVSEEEHRAIAEELSAFLSGHAKEIQRRLTAQMQAAAAELDFERAARLRDDLGALERAMERNSVVFDEGVDADVIGLAEDELEAAFEVFHVRGGRIRGQRSYIVEKVEDVTSADLVAHLLPTLYEEAEAIPPEILVPVDLSEDVLEWLRMTRGSRVGVRVPSRGPKRDLLDTVSRNADQRFALHKVRRAGDLTVRSKALTEIQEALALAEAPLRIEAIDISHLGGQGVVGSLVVFEDGAPRTRDYRTFKLSPEGSRDDTAAVAEVVTRRFRYEIPSEGGRHNDSDSPIAPRKPFAYPPQLLVIDGGRPQVQAASRALAGLGIDTVPVIGLAKRLEEVWLSDEEDPILLPRSSEGLYLLQRLRDEAHRFALAYQRRTRSRRATASVLETVPGLGPTRIKALLTRFGSARRLADAGVDELMSVPGIGRTTAEAILSALAGAPVTLAAEDRPGNGMLEGTGSPAPDAEEEPA